MDSLIPLWIPVQCLSRTNRNYKKPFCLGRKVPKNSPGGKRPLSGLNMKGFRLREGPHRSLCQGGWLGLPRIVAFEVRQRPRGIVGSGTEPDESGSREGLRLFERDRRSEPGHGVGLGWAIPDGRESWRSPRDLRWRR